MVTNIYDLELAITNHMTTIFDVDKIFVSKNVQDLSNKIFRDKPDVEAHAIIVANNGFNVDRISAGRNETRRQTLKVLYKLLVVSPESLYYDNAGVKFMEVISRMKSLSIDGCSDIKLFSLEGELNIPVYTNNMIALPMLYEFTLVV